MSPAIQTLGQRQRRPDWTESLPSPTAAKGLPSCCETEHPFYPLSAPGMPMPGPNFTEQALVMAGLTPGDPNLKKILKQHQAAKEYTDQLDAIYRLALWDPDFTLRIKVSDRVWTSVRLVLGHLWGLETADGPRRARVMIVGKHPGREEIYSKLNFVGPSGQVLSDALDYLGLDYRDFYVTNAVRWLNPSVSGSKMPAAWIKDCSILLHQELRLVRPDIVLCLGAEAIHAVLGRDHNLKNTVGRVLPLEIPLNEADDEPPVSHTCRVMTCTHPAAVLWKPELADAFRHQLTLLKRLLATEEGATYSDTEPDVKHQIIRDKHSLVRLTDQLVSGGYTEFALDAEWQGLFPAGLTARDPIRPDCYLRSIQFSWAPKKAAVIHLTHPGGKLAFEGGWDVIGAQLTRLLAGPNKRVIGHNLNADLPWLVNCFGLHFLEKSFDVPDDDPDPDGEQRLFGWQKTKTQGGFDTILAAHAWNETGDMSLKELAAALVGAPRYDTKVLEEVKRICKELGIPEKQLPGYGDVADEVLLPYAAYDADVTFRLYRFFNDQHLDCDRQGNCCREPFWISMKAAPLFGEMHRHGLLVDKALAEQLRETYERYLADRLQKFREMIRWPDFNQRSVQHRRELLFGEALNGAKLTAEDKPRRLRPPDAISFDMLPHKSTGKKSKLWEEIAFRSQEHLYSPSTDKETLSILGQKDPRVYDLRNIGYLEHVLKAVLRPPSLDESQNYVIDEDGELVYESGLLSFIQQDGRVHGAFHQTKETGRASSSRPALQNQSKAREDDYKLLLGDDYTLPLRAMFYAPPGCVLIEADYVGAEIFMTAVQSGDQAMIDHCLRGQLPGDHPDHYDIHSAQAIKVFNLLGPDGVPLRPSKSAVVEAGYESKRTAIKRQIFGYFYGMSAELCVRLCQAEGIPLTLEDAEQIIATLNATYPGLPAYFESCRARAENPGWLCYCTGRYRRFPKTYDEKVLGEQQRQAQNTLIQGGVADTISLSLGNLWRYREEHGSLRHKQWFHVVCQIHDALLFEVPIPAVEWVMEEVIPACMSRQCPVWPCDLDGRAKYDPRAPYHLDTERTVMERWGVKLMLEDAQRLGVPETYAAKPKKKKETK